MTTQDEVFKIIVGSRIENFLIPASQKESTTEISLAGDSNVMHPIGKLKIIMIGPSKDTETWHHTGTNGGLALADSDDGGNAPTQMSKYRQPAMRILSGKTALANFLSEAVQAGDPNGDATRPTKGTRIVEFELTDVGVTNNTRKVDIELWDCSGDHRYEGCWPAIRAGAHGAVLVCSPSTAANVARELELLYGYFVSQPKLSPRQCVVMYNAAEQKDDVRALNLSSTFSKVSQVPVNIVSGGNRLKIDFSNFISSVIQSAESK